jgi:hypothetical protein
MLKILVILLYWLQQATGDFVPKNPVGCYCPVVENVQVSGGGFSTFSFAWSEVSSATHYKVKYVRHDDEFVSNETVVNGTAFTYSNLPGGRYTFYVAAVCGEEVSGWVGIEDVIIL